MKRLRPRLNWLTPISVLLLTGAAYEIRELWIIAIACVAVTLAMIWTMIGFIRSIVRLR